MSQNTVIALTSAALLFATATARAQPSGYIGAAIGQSEVELTGYDQPSSWQLFGGARLSQAFAVEAAYAYLGKFNLSGGQNTHYTADGFELTLVGRLPLSERISIFGEAGLFAWNLDVTISGTDLGTEDGINGTYGAGVKFALTPPLDLHLEYQTYANIRDADINTLSAGLSYGF
jgi:OOP family OmpA-OmpF porin